MPARRGRCTGSRNVPRIADVDTMASLLDELGLPRALGRRPRALDRRAVRRAARAPTAPAALVERLRASIVVLGPLLARCGSAALPLPGGDDFGDAAGQLPPRGPHGDGRGRPRGAAASSRPTTPPPGRLRGARITLEYPSHTATDNLLMAAVTAEGTTVIDNAAREPEVEDLAAMLNAMGASIEGLGTSRLVIEGVDALRPADHDGRRRPRRRRHVPRRRDDHRRRGDRRRRAPRAHGDAAAQARDDRRRAHAASPGSRPRARRVRARATSRRCRIRASRRTTSRSSSRCSRSPTAPRS